MGIFDDVVINAKSAVNVVGKKAEQLVDLSKLKYAESGIHHEIEEKLRDLGGFVYESTIAGETDAKLLEKKIEQLTGLSQQLEMTREMLAAAKNKKCCKACGSINDKEAFICHKCGAKLQKDKKPGQPSKGSGTNEKSTNAEKKPKSTAGGTSTQE